MARFKTKTINGIEVQELVDCPAIDAKMCIAMICGDMDEEKVFGRDFIENLNHRVALEYADLLKQRIEEDQTK